MSWKCEEAFYFMLSYYDLIFFHLEHNGRHNQRERDSIFFFKFVLRNQWCLKDPISNIVGRSNISLEHGFHETSTHSVFCIKEDSSTPTNWNIYLSNNFVLLIIGYPKCDIIDHYHLILFGMIYKCFFF